RSSAVTLCISAHCSLCAPGGVSQRICQSPWTDLTAPCALARSLVPRRLAVINTARTVAATNAGAHARSCRTQSLRAIIDPSICRQDLSSSRPGQVSANHAARSGYRALPTGWAWRVKGPERQAIVAAPRWPRRIGAGHFIARESRRVHAVMSALQQSRICGLEGPEFAARPARDIAPRDKARRSGWRYTVAARGEIRVRVRR